MNTRKLFETAFDNPKKMLSEELFK